jgi:hypothetical protein
MFGFSGGGFRSQSSGARRFWSWFGAEADGLANSLEALSRGETDAETAFAALNARMARFDDTLQADLVRTLDGGSELRLSGGREGSMQALLETAPRRAGWRFAPAAAHMDARRVPFRLAPRPSLDALSFDALPIDAVANYARREAYA